MLIGRPYLYGLAADGRRGVDAVLAVLRREMAGTMRLLGAGSLVELDATRVRPRAGFSGAPAGHGPREIWP